MSDIVLPQVLNDVSMYFTDNNIEEIMSNFPWKLWKEMAYKNRLTIWNWPKELMHLNGVFDLKSMKPYQLQMLVNPIIVHQTREKERQAKEKEQEANEEEHEANEEDVKYAHIKKWTDGKSIAS